MNKMVAYNDDLGLCLMTPSPRALQTRTIQEIANKDVPSGFSYVVIDVSELPTVREFIDCWELNNNIITENLNKAKEIAHQKRRAKRDLLFAPYDKIISAQIPNTDITAIEQARADIRVADALVQESIDLATTTEELKTIIENYEAL